MMERFRHRTCLLLGGIALAWLVGLRPVAAQTVFTAVAEAVPVRGGSSGQMPVTIVVRREASEVDCQQLKKVLEAGGQQALVAALRGRADGTLRLGALEQPLSLITFRPLSKGRRLVVVTPRRLQIEEVNEGSESLDYPFGVAAVDLDGWDSGDGLLYNAAALAVDPEGNIAVKAYRDAPGRLLNVRRQ